MHLNTGFNLAKQTVSVHEPFQKWVLTNVNVLWYSWQQAIACLVKLASEAAYSKCRLSHHALVSPRWRKHFWPATCKFSLALFSRRSLPPTTSMPLVPFKQITCLRSTMTTITEAGKLPKLCPTSPSILIPPMQLCITQSSALKAPKPIEPSMIRSSYSDRTRTSAEWTSLTCSLVSQHSTDGKC